MLSRKDFLSLFKNPKKQSLNEFLKTYKVKTSIETYKLNKYIEKKEIDVTNTFRLVLSFAPKRFFIAILKSIIYADFGLDIFSSLIIFPSSKWIILLR